MVRPGVGRPTSRGPIPLKAAKVSSRRMAAGTSLTNSGSAWTLRGMQIHCKWLSGLLS